MSWSEDDIHRWLARRKQPRALAAPLGHDAATLKRASGRSVVCADQTVEGVHFDTTARAELVGRKAAARAISDLAATAAQPLAVLLAICAPSRTSAARMRGWIRGVEHEARAHGADLVGGDLCAAEGPAKLTVTAIGVLRGSSAPPGRTRASAGQLVVLTGPVGGSRLGRHLRIRPRVQAGRTLARAGATAMMDVSDGLAWDLFRLARASRVRIDLDLAAVPMHADARRRARRTGKSPMWHALHDGEDHELIATIAARALDRLPRSIVAIGSVRTGAGLFLHEDGRERRWSPAEGGFRHGA